MFASPALLPWSHRVGLLVRYESADIDMKRGGAPHHQQCLIPWLVSVLSGVDDPTYKDSSFPQSNDAQAIKNMTTIRTIIPRTSPPDNVDYAALCLASKVLDARTIPELSQQATIPSWKNHIRHPKQGVT